MGVALAEAARAAEAGEVPIGAVLVRDDLELGRGHNRPIATHDPTAHAEVVALRAAGQREQAYRLPGTTLYVTIEPCSLCFGAALQARVARIVYGARDPKGGAAGSVVDLRALPGVNHEIEVCGGVRAEEGATLLRDFFRVRRTEPNRGRPGG